MSSDGFNSWCLIVLECHLVLFEEKWIHNGTLILLKESGSQYKITYIKDIVQWKFVKNRCIFFLNVATLHQATSF